LLPQLVAQGFESFARVILMCFSLFSKPVSRPPAARWCALLLFVLLTGTSMGALPSVRLAWDPNPESNIKGYRIYYGQTGLGQTNVVDVGNQTSGSVTNLAFATPYFFYVTAYNVFDLESDPSAVLTHTTRSRVPLGLSIDGYLIALAPSAVTLRARLSGDLLPGASPSINWQQGSGPVSLVMTAADSLAPTVQFEAPGQYSFLVTVTEGATSLAAFVSVDVIASDPSTGGDHLQLEPPVFLFDGIVLSWNSRPGYSYDIGFKRDLNDRFWVVLARDIASQGYLTYWIDDAGLASSPAGFFTIFNSP
jgi:hypothetical protein